VAPDDLDTRNRRAWKNWDAIPAPSLSFGSTLVAVLVPRVRGPATSFAQSPLVPGPHLSQLRFGTPSDAWVLHSLEQIHYFDTQSLGDQMQATQRYVHPAILERSHLCAVKAGQVRKFILRPAALPP
jgi:hypothetical protein